MSLISTRSAAVAGTVTAALLVGGAVVAPSMAYAAETMTCHADAPEIGYIGNIVLASGKGEGRPGTMAGGSIAVLSERISGVHIDVSIHRFSGGEQIVASAGDSVDGPSTYFNAHESTWAEADVKYRGTRADFNVMWQAETTVECRSTGGTWKSDTARSKVLTLNTV